MSLTNVVVCMLYYNSSENTTFTCENGYNGEDHTAPTFDDPDTDIYNVTTITAELYVDADTTSSF